VSNMIANNGPAKETLTLFPEKSPFYYNVPKYYGVEASCSNNTNICEESTSIFRLFFFYPQGRALLKINETSISNTQPTSWE